MNSDLLLPYILHMLTPLRIRTRSITYREIVKVVSPMYLAIVVFLPNNGEH